jgi:hypothetical protein
MLDTTFDQNKFAIDDDKCSLCRNIKDMKFKFNFLFFALFYVGNLMGLH